jgi:hypothetical protein
MPAGAVERNGLNGRDTDHGRFGMFQHLAHVGRVLAFAIVKASAAVTRWAEHKANQAGRYRPEAHYMRGPGPKWRAKHARVSTGREFRQLHE